MQIEIPDHLYEKFLAIVDAGLQFLDDGANKDEWSEDELEVFHIAEERLWEEDSETIQCGGCKFFERGRWINMATGKDEGPQHGGHCPCF